MSCWDLLLPRAVAVAAFAAQDGGGFELSLAVGDAVRVLAARPDGWHVGKRLRDGAVGLYPASAVTVELSRAERRQLRLDGSNIATLRDLAMFYSEVRLLSLL